MASLTIDHSFFLKLNSEVVYGSTSISTGKSHILTTLEILLGQCTFLNLSETITKS